ncbi:MAG: aldo/keto reductase [Ruminococcaceae bacterium]|nr:aldo/keto reductase [Oscillospiraceae bacterium]
MKKITDVYKLSNGVEIPCVGFGTWQTPDGETAISSVKAALEAGYRHIDTAAIYRNESGVGEAIRESGIDRGEIFVTSKVWNKCRGYDLAMEGFERTMSKLQLGYLDLYLIHWPASPERFDDWKELNLGTWKAMTELYKSGRIRAIGVSNFLPHHLEPLMETEIAPMVDQIEFHPGYMQSETVEYCRKNGILVEAWSPLGTGRMLTNETLIELGKKYDRSVAQICIRWCLQKGTLPLPKSVTPSRIIENSKVFDFEITDEDMAIIDRLPNFGGSGLHPDKIEF